MPNKLTQPLHQAELLLHTCDELHSAIIQTAMDGYWLVDMQGRMLEVNEAYSAMSGYSRQELLSMNVTDFDADKREGKTAARIRQLKTSCKARFETQHQRRDGSLFDIEISLQHHPLEGGRIVAFLRDITEKKNIMAQLLHAQKMESVGELAGGLAHDLNNILTVINGYTCLIQRKLTAEQKESTYLHEITEATSRAATLIRSLLTYGRRQVMNRQNRDLNPLIETIGAFIARLIRENIEFTVSLFNEPLVVFADVVQIEQVLLNLAHQCARCDAKRWQADHHHHLGHN